MKNKALVIAHLHEMWDEQISKGYMTKDEMHASLLAQINGEMDLSPDELTDDRAELIGWDINHITNEQWDIWENLVVEAATEYIRR